MRCLYCRSVYADNPTEMGTHLVQAHKFELDPQIEKLNPSTVLYVKLKVTERLLSNVAEMVRDNPGLVLEPEAMAA